MSSPLETGDLPAVAVNLEASFEPVRDTVLDLKERVEDMCNQELGKITKQGSSAKGFASSACLSSHSSSFFALLPVFFQSMTQRCLRWETVSFKRCCVFAAVSNLLLFIEFCVSFS